MAQYRCSVCGTPIERYSDVGYHGCEDLLAGWVVKCLGCHPADRPVRMHEPQILVTNTANTKVAARVGTRRGELMERLAELRQDILSEYGVVLTHFRVTHTRLMADGYVPMDVASTMHFLKNLCDCDTTMHQRYVEEACDAISLDRLAHTALKWQSYQYSPTTPVQVTGLCAFGTFRELFPRVEKGDLRYHLIRVWDRDLENEKISIRDHLLEIGAEANMRIARLL